jgi:uncharacterized lipoprotein YajG
MRTLLALAATLLLAGCASEDQDYSSSPDSNAPVVRFAKPAGEPGASVKETF